MGSADPDSPQMQEATLRMWLCDLASTKKPVRMVAAGEVIAILGLEGVITAMQTDGPLAPPPEWPRADIVPVGTGRDHLGAFIQCKVRTRLGGVVEESVRMNLGPRGTSHQAAINDAYDRGLYRLRARIEGLVLPPTG